jgi:hypothetical protein
MAQPPQAEAADGGANVAQLCAAQKLLYADAIAPAHPQNAAKAPTMENLKPLQLGGPDGPGLCSIQQDRKHQAAIYARFDASGDLPAAPELYSPLHCCIVITGPHNDLNTSLAVFYAARHNDCCVCASNVGLECS